MDFSLLNKPYTLTKEQIQFYENNAFIKIKEVLTSEIIMHFNAIISKKVAEWNKLVVPIEERDTYGKAFLQLFNLWTEDEKIKELVFSTRVVLLNE